MEFRFFRVTGRSFQVVAGKAILSGAQYATRSHNVQVIESKTKEREIIDRDKNGKVIHTEKVKEITEAMCEVLSPLEFIKGEVIGLLSPLPSSLRTRLEPADPKDGFETFEEMAEGASDRAVADFARELGVDVPKNATRNETLGLVRAFFVSDSIPQAIEVGLPAEKTAEEAVEEKPATKAAEEGE